MRVGSELEGTTLKPSEVALFVLSQEQIDVEVDSEEESGAANKLRCTKSTKRESKIKFRQHKDVTLSHKEIIEFEETTNDT